MSQNNINNLMRHKKPNYYHWSWLQIALENFINNKDIVKIIPINKTIGEFIKENAKFELDEIVDIK